MRLTLRVTSVIADESFNGITYLLERPTTWSHFCRVTLYAIDHFKE